MTDAFERARIFRRRRGARRVQGPAVMNVSGFTRLLPLQWFGVGPQASTERRAPFVLKRTSALFLILEILAAYGAIYAFNILAGTAYSAGPTACRWCSQNAFDEWERSWLVADDRLAAAALSHQFSAGVMGVIALGSALAPLPFGPRRRAAAQNLVITLAVVMLTFAIIDPVKGLVARERPGFFHAMITEAVNDPAERFVSFFSGDTAVAFALGACATAIAYLRGYRSAKAIAVISAVCAAFAGIGRIRADMHWATDVMTGALVGTLVGAGLPLLLHRRKPADA
jgi:membrane-associated phospholipid phosphatase